MHSGPLNAYVGIALRYLDSYRLIPYSVLQARSEAERRVGRYSESTGRLDPGWAGPTIGR
jgi:hypothetical protein